MKIATWNVNSIRQRMDCVVAWLAERAPEIVCLQEIKCQDDAFPREPLEALGYNIAVHGQKTFNGVALLSKSPFDEVKSGLMGDSSDLQARFLEALVSTKGAAVRVVSLYLPNGNPAPGEKYEYKLKWMDRLIAFSRERLELEEPLILQSRADRRAAGRHRCRPGSIHVLGLPGRRLAKNHGLRIDHLLLSPQASDRLIDVGIDSYVRGWEKPSDHVPVWIDLDLEGR
jgi:exodeoxyribonuclease-3